MKIEKYTVLYRIDGKTIKEICKRGKILDFIGNLLGKDNMDTILYIQPVFESDAEKKDKYYKSQYSKLSRDYKSNKICEDDFNRYKEKLKELKELHILKEDLKREFEEYKKNTNNIPPYIASK